MLRNSLLLAALALVVPAAGPARADLITFDTSENPFVTGSRNQGWWTKDRIRNVDINGHLVGRLNDREYANFFTFDLRSLDLAGRSVISATLELTRAKSLGLFPVDFLLHHVSTDAETLNTGNGANPAIFEDLRSGTSYGRFEVGSGGESDLLSFSLNEAALDDITAGAGGFFSVGGSLDLTGHANGDRYLFGSSGNLGIQRLVLGLDAPAGSDDPPGDLGPSEPMIATPEPSALVLFGVMTATLAGYRRWRRARD